MTSKTERIIECLNSMSNSHLAYTMASICYEYNLYLDFWQDMEDFDEVMEDVEPSYTVKLVLEAGMDFDMSDEFFRTDKMNYIQSADANEVGKCIKNDVEQYAHLIIAYGVQYTLDDELNNIIERGDN